MDKKAIAEIFEEIALLLEMQEANPFRIRAYRNAARALLNTDKDLKSLIGQKSLTQLEGIGKDLAEKIEILATKGRLPFYETLKKSIPKGVLQLREISGLGAKKIKALYKTLKIDSLAALKKACEQGKVAKLQGFGKKTEQNLLAALAAKATYAKRHLWWDAWTMALPILERLRKIQGVSQAEIAGSLRRKGETIGDLDFIVASREPQRVIEWFATQKSVTRVLAKGETKTSVLLKGGVQADLRVVQMSEFGYALLYFTGSKEHNVRLREMALKKGWSLNEYGISQSKQGGKLPRIGKAPSEEEIYKAFGLPFIPPELREDRGEFAAAKGGKIPHLIEVKDVRGTLHNHTTESDGKSTLKEMVRAAEEMGWEYFGISDHSKSSFQAGGLSEERVEAQIAAIAALNRSKLFRPFVFAGTECDILPNGKLDFPDSLLKRLDFVIVSIHSALTQEEKKITDRLIRAIEHPLSTIVGHVTSRLLLQREPTKVNVQKVIDACIANKKVVELNGNPKRLDMDWRLWHNASEKGLLCCINVDAHDARDLSFIETGVNTAKKGWLEKKHVINTLPLFSLQSFFRKMRGL